MPENFGKLNLMLSLVSLVTPLMAVGLNSIISREVLARPEDNSFIMGSAFVSRLVFSFAILPLLIWLSYRYLGANDAFLLTFLLFSSLFNAAHIVDFWLQAHLANGYASAVRIITLVLFSMARIVAIETDADVSTFVYLAGLELVSVGCLYIFLYNRLAGGVAQLRVSWRESKRLLKDARWLVLSGVAGMVYLKVDQVMIGQMVNDRAVGIYAAAARISEVWYFAPAAIVAVFFPRMINHRVMDPKIYLIDLQKINDFLLYSALVVALIVSFCASWLVPILFGAAYEGAIPILVVHIWAGLFVFMRTLLSKWFIAENLLKLSMVSQVLGALVNVLLNLKLIPLYGSIGAAYATVISFAVAGYAALFLHRDLWPMALVVSRSFLLPLRLLRKGRGLYKV
jgi:PST family polysaccharide transporter